MMELKNITRTTLVDLHEHNGSRPVYDVYIGRRVDGTEFIEDSIWANPYVVQNYRPKDIKETIMMYKTYIIEKIRAEPAKYDLRKLIGKRLGCWCVRQQWFFPGACHGSVLILLILKKYGSGLRA